MEHIFYIENRIPELFITKVIKFYKKYDKYHIRTVYGEGENTKVQTLSVNRMSTILSDEEYDTDKNEIMNIILDLLKDILKSEVVSKQNYITHLFETDNCYFSTFDIRQVYGPTRKHVDGTNPVYYTVNNTTKLFARTMTILLNITENNDIIHFPDQDLHIPLRKGSIVIFPSYWTYPHFTTFDPAYNRMTIQTWLMESFDNHRLNTPHFIHLNDRNLS